MSLEIRNRPIYDPNAAAVAMATIAGLDLKIVSIEKILELLVPIFKGYLVEVPIFHPGIEVYRGRICEKPTHIDGLMSPPPETAKAGRSNRKGQPIFYCCTLRSVVFFECRPIAGQHLVLGKWTTTDKLLLNHVGYTSQSFTRLKSKRANAGWGDRPTTQLNPQVALFLADIFTQQVSPGSEHLYKVSTAITEKLISADFIHGLLYPTIAMGANADNLAVKPDSCKKLLRFKSAEYVRVDEVKDSSFEITVLDSATSLSPDGLIQWKGRRGNWTLGPNAKLTFTVENGEWIARNDAGQIVDPE